AGSMTPAAKSSISRAAPTRMGLADLGKLSSLSRCGSEGNPSGAPSGATRCTGGGDQSSVEALHAGRNLLVHPRLMVRVHVKRQATVLVVHPCLHERWMSSGTVAARVMAERYLSRHEGSMARAPPPPSRPGPSA